MMSNKVYFQLTDEPIGPLYNNILDWCMTQCKYAILVVQNSITLEKSGKQILLELAPSLESEEETSEWPGTTLFGVTAHVYKYVINLRTINVLKESVSSLYGWKQPLFPEDLCLLRQDSSPLLFTISHEADGYFYLFEDEYQQLINAIPDLSTILSRD